MSSAGSSQAFRLAIEPSRRLRALLGAVHLVAVAALACTALPSGCKLGLGAAVALSAWRCDRGARRPPIRALEVPVAGPWRLELADGRVEAGRPVAFRVHPSFVLLRIAADGRLWPRALLLLPDAAPPDALRALRVWLLAKCR